MKLLELEMENFRQYMGKQKISFAASDKNITIIFGENGKGKTGVFRALMFGLYGSTHIQQDNPLEPVHLASMKLLLDESRPVNTSVRILFEHRRKKYEIVRTLKGIKRGVRIEERIGSVKLVEIDEHGNYGSELIDDELRVKNIINEILDEEIKDFFLFDGEKIDTLAKTNVEVKKEVKSAIFKLLQINNVEEARVLIEQLAKSEKQAAIRAADNINISAKENEIDQQKKELTHLTTITVELESEQSENVKLINQYELQLSQNEDIRILQEHLKSYQNNLSMKTVHLNDLKIQSVDSLKKDVSFLLFNEPFKNVSNYLEQITVDQTSLVPANVLDLTLTTKVCACCNNDLTLHQENLTYVQALKDNYKRSELTSMSTAIKNLITDRENTAQESEKQIIILLRKVKEIERERKDIIEDIRLAKNEINSKATTELNLENIKVALDHQVDSLNKTKVYIERNKQELEKAERQLQELESELTTMLRNNESLHFDSKVLELMDDIRQDLVNISDEFSTSMRHQLRDLTTDIFKKLIDRKDINLINSVNINEKFEIQIIGNEGIEITQDISQGQRQIVALSFITALAQIATGDNFLITFPLFMDSPFNRLSAVNRDQLIVNIPNLTSQWILLLTDTELTVSEERVFKDNGRLGKFYSIIQNDVMDATIQEVALHEPLTTRGV